MVDQPPDVRVEDDATGPVIRFAGRIDRDAQAPVGEAWALASERVAPGGWVTLDFSAADYINSTGIALVVGLLADARRLDRRIRGRGLSTHYREIFRITRLTDYMTIEESAAPAGGDAAEVGRP